MTTETNKEKLHKHLIAAIFAAVKHPLISTIIGGIVVAIIVWIFGINPLENKIQQQNTTIERLENNVISFKTTIEQQNITIEKLENNVASFETTIEQQNIDIKKIEQIVNKGNIFNAPVKARDIIGTKTTSSDSI